MSGSEILYRCDNASCGHEAMMASYIGTQFCSRPLCGGVMRPAMQCRPAPPAKFSDIAWQVVGVGALVLGVWCFALAVLTAALQRELAHSYTFALWAIVLILISREVKR